jgi:hypothetical protein
MSFSSGSVLARVTEGDDNGYDDRDDQDYRVNGGNEYYDDDDHYDDDDDHYHYDDDDVNYGDYDDDVNYDDVNYNKYDDHGDDGSYNGIIQPAGGVNNSRSHTVPSTFYRPLNAFSGRSNRGGDVDGQSGIARDYNMTNVILIALIIALIVAFAYYMWNKKHAVKKANQAHPHQPTPTPAPRPAPNPVHGGHTKPPMPGHSGHSGGTGGRPPLTPKHFTGDLDSTCTQQHYKKTTFSDTSA